METRRRIERIVGWLFILATVSSSLGFILLNPILDDVNVLESVGSNENTVIAAGLLLLVNAVAVVIIPALLFPTLREHNPHLARLYPGSRIMEAAVLAVGVVGLFSLVTLSRNYLASVGDAASYETLAVGFMAVYEWGVLLGIMFFFALAGLLLNYVLFQYRLVPRWLAVWGLVGVALLFIQGAAEIFETDNLEIMSLPFAVQEMVFAIWLIVNGFSRSGSPASSAEELAGV